MAGAIKGITIQIEGNTSGLVKSLQSVESQIKKDDAALKNLEKALELDPKNVDLLAAKEAVLAEKTALTAEKLEILQQVQSDALNDLPEDAQLIFTDGRAPGRDRFNKYAARGSRRRCR